MIYKLNNREPRIEILPEKKLVGKSMKMSLANNKTFELWQSFMPRRKYVKNRVSADLYSMQVYENTRYFKDFNPHTAFTKWATVEVSSFHDIPEDLETYRLTGGLYAVFVHKGTSSEFPKTFQSIYDQWLPNSDHELDNREHFELLGEKYKNNDPNSEEEVWIPIKRKENDR